MTAGRELDPSTLAVHAGRPPRTAGEPLNPPLTLASVLHAGVELEYGRATNPVWEALEEVIGALEGGTAVTFASGVAAIDAVLEMLPPRARVVVPSGAYLGARALFDDAQGRGRLAAVHRTDIADTEATLALCDGADLLWIETPTNPLLEVADLPALCAGAHERGARVAVDNTFATPLLQRPLEHGADFVVHSVTKLMSGHSDLLLGAVITDPARAERCRERRLRSGAIPATLGAWLALRGLRTLALRLERAQANAADLAGRLAAHPAVARVRYPGMPAHPHADRVRRQMTGPGNIVSFETVGDAAAAQAVVDACRLVMYATSLGGIETSIERRERQPGETEAGVPPTLLRMSVGCEHVEDVWADLDQALSAARDRDAR